MSRRRCCCGGGCACSAEITLTPCVGGGTAGGVAVVLRTTLSAASPVVASGTTDSAGKVSLCIPAPGTYYLWASGSAIYPLSASATPLTCGGAASVVVTPKVPVATRMIFCNDIQKDWLVTITRSAIGYSYSTVCSAGWVYWVPPEIGAYTLTFTDPDGCMTTFTGSANVTTARICESFVFSFQQGVWNSGVCTDPCAR